jgi:hypothetical protein
MMKHILFSAGLIIMISAMPVIVLGQLDTTKKAVPDSARLKIAADSAKKIVDTVAKKPDSSSVAATPMNCYKQWLDVFSERGVKPLTDGMQEVVIAFKSKESCHCYMGRVQVAGGKITAPLYVQTEGGDYKTFTAMGKKLDPEFLAAQGDALWHITNGMSALFQTVDQEYGRVFFYKSLNKNKQANKEAPSPADLLK